MKKYMNDITHLTLTAKAQRGYLSEDPLAIYEHTDGDDGYLYDIKASDIWTRNLTEQEVNDELEARADMMDEFLREERLNEVEGFHWTIEGWGDDEPPVNADEIISRANELIDNYALDRNDDDAVEAYAADLWERYCRTGTLDG